MLASVEHFFAMVGIEEYCASGHGAKTFNDGSDDVVGIEYAVVVVVDILHSFGVEPRLFRYVTVALEFVEFIREA